MLLLSEAVPYVWAHNFAKFHEESLNKAGLLSVQCVHEQEDNIFSDDSLCIQLCHKDDPGISISLSFSLSSLTLFSLFAILSSILPVSLFSLLANPFLYHHPVCVEPPYTCVKSTCTRRTNSKWLSMRKLGELETDIFNWRGSHAHKRGITGRNIALPATSGLGKNKLAASSLLIINPYMFWEYRNHWAW